MDEIYLNRLTKFIANIKSLACCSRVLCMMKSWSSEDTEQAKILSSKLQSVLNLFNRELYQYFNISTNPNADEISNMTTEQLEGEEALAELNSRVQARRDKASSSSTSNSSQSVNRGKLPELVLPTFSGDVLQWTQFWDQFSSIIDQRELRDVDKLQYLKTSLKGEARTILEGLETTNDNYKIAMTTLTDRYGKKTQIIDAHYSTLYKLRRAEKQEECRKTLDEIERHLRVLGSLGENTEHNHLRFLIMEKFPEEVIYELKLKLSNDTVEELRKQLHIVLSAREDAKRTFGRSNPEETSYTTETLHVKEENIKRKPKPQKPTTVKIPNKRFKPNITAFNKVHNIKRNLNIKEEKDGPSQKKRKLCCIFCKGDHFNDECMDSKTIQQRKAKLKNRCYNCFQMGHTIKNCRSRSLTCRHCGKKGLHNRALCPTKEPLKKESTSALHVHGKESTILQTAVINVEGIAGETIKCRALLDSGSMRSYVTRDVAKKLNLETVEHSHLVVFTFGSDKPQELDSPLVKLHIQSRTNKQRIVYANVVPSITSGISPHSEELNEWEHQKKYLLADDGSLSDRVDILIGNDYYHSIMESEKVRIRENLYLVNSDLGWILSGKTKIKYEDELSVLTYFQASYETKLSEPDLPLDNACMKTLWDLESIGITDSPSANREEEAIKHFNENATVINGRYHVSWPWKEYPPELPTNYGLAYGRLVGLLKRLDSETLSAYNQTMNDQLQKGIIEAVPKRTENDHPIHFLAHHAVQAPGKSLRIVYDASAKTRDTKSLNECLFCGPMMLEDLTGLLVKFRCHAIGITADVEKAFLQIALNNNDRDVTRFLWIKDINKPVTQDNVLQYRFTRVPFGIICSPFLLNATVKHHLQRSDEHHAKQLANDIYVDNILTGVDTEEDALDLYNEGKKIFAEISMNLREWSSNSKDFTSKIQDTIKETNVKILGLNWNLEEDTLQLKAKVNKVNANTKRGILKTIAAIFDPCGFSAPIMLPAKLLLQQLWKERIKWDTSLKGDLLQKWKDILEDIKQVETINLPRNITIPNEKNAQIHCFTDSSTLAYSAVVYLAQNKTINFIIGKSRLVPIKDQEHLKIARLELLGVLIGSRLIKFVIRFLPLNITRMTLWTDSQIVIDWYHSNKLLEPFVSKRIEEIKQNKNLIVRYVPSSLNPADSATRPTSSDEERSKWLSGPDFLKQDAKTWPKGPSRTASLLTREDVPSTEQQSNITLEGRLVSDKALDSQLQEIRELQKITFPEEYKGKKTHLFKNLQLFMDTDGILRCEGRLIHSDLQYDAKHPILLPKNSKLTEKIVKETHEKNLHVGVPHTLSLVRQKFWIPQGRTQVQKVLNKCARCVKHGGGPYELPKTPALPVERVKYTTAFTYVGADYFGPMVIKSENGLKKRWICLFTCLVIRAIHLEVVKDLTTDECLMALRRFIATRGTPALMLTDNAPQFRLLSEVIVANETLTERMKWKFIPQLAPWHGGVYERLVALVKHCLRRTLQKHMLGENQLSTIIKEAEAVVNTRPLTYVGADLDHVLKPADFLTPGRCLNVQILMENLPLTGSIVKQQLIEGWRRGNIIMNEYREMFVNRYLLSLRERYRNSPKQARVRSHNSPQIDDVVQIKGTTKNRESWKVGKIIELIKGKDNLCRVAKVKVGNSIFTRSIAHLYPLEAEVEETLSKPADIEEDLEETDFNNESLFQISPADILEMETKNSVENNNNDSVENIEKSTQERHDLTQDTKELDTSTINDAEVNKDQYSNDLENEVQINEEFYNQVNEGKQQRAAAVQALGKIHQWTRDLMSTMK